MNPSFDIEKFLADNKLELFTSVQGRPVASLSNCGNAYVFDKDKPELYPSSMVESEGQIIDKTKFDEMIAKLRKGK